MFSLGYALGAAAVSSARTLRCVQKQWGNRPPADEQRVLSRQSAGVDRRWIVHGRSADRRRMSSGRSVDRPPTKFQRVRKNRFWFAFQLALKFKPKFEIYIGFGAAGMRNGILSSGFDFGAIERQSLGHPGPNFDMNNFGFQFQLNFYVV
ncbi:hypothetical protein B0H17DRAFT_1128442 [Mycena rosella]|uniref:Uncharacterized protein n=1 Tax=Mycena rosella TaxID=1033263 RepID=A0AAD7DYX2_MYCRO|nr:hypothetical protein B0H17DRAFT_1128442 [Mycena rosella]